MMVWSLEVGVEGVGYQDGGEVPEDQRVAMLMPQKIEQPMLIVKEKA